jgi:hypothetical protein
VGQVLRKKLFKMRVTLECIHVHEKVGTEKGVQIFEVTVALRKGHDLLERYRKKVKIMFFQNIVLSQMLYAPIKCYFKITGV